LKRKNSGALWQDVISPDLLSVLLIGEEKRSSQLPYYFLALLWILAIFSLAGPAWQKLPQSVEKRIDAQVIILDLSLSMLADDIKPSRLARAKHKLRDILKQRDEGVTGLVVYSGDAHVVSPLTDDNQTILALAPSLGPELMPVPGSNALAAIQTAQNLLQNAQAKNGKIILITDGIDKSQLGDINKQLAKSKHTLSILGIGTATGAPIKMPDGSLLKDKHQRIVIPQLENAPLIKLSRKHGGHYSDISNDDSDINDLLSNSIPFSKADYKSTERDFDLWQEEGPWLLVLILPLAGLAFRRGWLGICVVGVFASTSLLPSPAEAFEWQDLWETPNQQGQTLYQKGDYEHAAETFKSSDWKASSYYNQGEYEKAIDYFSQNDDASNHYNRANALAKSGNLEDALNHYQKALDQQGDFDDAQFNYDLVEKLLEQQQEEQSEQQQNSEDQDQAGDQENDNAQENQDSSQDGQPQDSPLQEEQADKNDDEKQSENEPESNPSQQENAQQSEDENQENTEPKEAQATPSELADMSEQEKKQELEQWLRRVPDDPGGLLRRKFYLESQQKQSRSSDKQW
ncbi:MAG: VWA domain-containing protein, partial [Pseudomonadales bacterium]|nr:VWA domain-containing protein [Pseudomonadales bacterium]